MADKEKTHKGIFGIFLDFFAGSGERKELRRLSKHLTSKGYRYVKHGQVQPAFASLVYSFYRQTAESREILNKFSKPEAMTYAVLLAIVPEHIRGLLLHVEPNEIRMRASSVPWTALRDEIKTALITIKDFFSPQVLSRANEAYEIVYSYRTFCMYDFYLLLKYFNGNFKENNFEKEPRFSAASGYNTVGYIADLETAIRFFLIASDWEVLKRFFMSIGQIEAISRDDHGVLYQKATHLENDSVFLSMCKIIKQDIKYEINQAIVPPGKIESMLSKIFHDADATIKEIFQNQKKAKIETLTSNLFDEDSNITLDYYSTKISEQLSARKFGHFEYAEPLGYLHAYFVENIADSMKQFSDSLTIKGKSTMPAFMKEFFQMVDELETIFEGIEKLDLKSAPTSPVGYRVTQAAKSKGDGYIDVSHLARDIEILNGEAAILMRKAQNALPVFRDIISRLSEDAEKHHGEIIENWKEIHSSSDKSAHEYLAPLVDKTEKISTLLSIFNAQS